MIYITGYTFQFTGQSRIQTNSTSIQERIALSRNNKQSNAFDPRFIINDTYKISRIRKHYEENKILIQYYFTNLSQQIDDIVINFPNSAAGDDYIASLSRQTQQLEEERKAIQASLEVEKF